MMNVRPVRAGTAKDNARFWSKVDVRGAGECWLWKSGLRTNGYGQFHISYEKKRYTSVAASRYAYALAHGEAPADVLVLHSCDVRHCCNPKHLRAGTHEENMKDMASRKRGRGGPPRKLTMKDARAIRALSYRTPIKALARRYGINKRGVQLIVRGVAYREAGAS